MSNLSSTCWIYLLWLNYWVFIKSLWIYIFKIFFRTYSNLSMQIFAFVSVRLIFWQNKLWLVYFIIHIKYYNNKIEHLIIHFFHLHTSIIHTPWRILRFYELIISCISLHMSLLQSTKLSQQSINQLLLNFNLKITWWFHEDFFL